MADQGTCGSCQSCQNNCNGCNNSCNICNSGCNSCNVTCESKQTICDTDQTLSGHVGPFSWGTVCVANGQKIMKRNEWKTIYDFINKREKIGTKVSGGTNFGAPPTCAGTLYWSAAEFNKIYKELSGSNYDLVKKNDSIRGTYFQNLVTYANAYKISDKACNSCNANCDGGCNACNNNCNTCNTYDGNEKHCSGKDASCGNCCDTPPPSSDK